MKQFCLLFAISVFSFITSIDAQTCNKINVLQAAVQQQDILEKKDIATGQTVYMQKQICPVTGDVRYAEVEFCSRTGRFVEATPKMKKTCTKLGSACAKTYSSMASRTALYGTTAQKAACFQANEKAKTAKAAYVATSVKP